MKIRFTSLIGGLMVIPALLASAGTGQGPYRDVQILQSDERGVTLEFMPEYFRPRIFALGQRAYSDYNFYGSVSVGLEKTGFPNLRNRLLSVALPSEGGNSMEGIGTEYEEIQNTTIV